MGRSGLSGGYVVDFYGRLGIGFASDFSVIVSGGVVKLVITSACHAEGRGFESRHSRHFDRGLGGKTPSPKVFK